MPEYINNDEKLHQSLIRAVKVLHANGFSVTEIAALLRIPESTIRVMS
jgi:DNA-binding NarL/FixJ family response regulator